MIDIYTFKPRLESCHAQNKEGRDCYSTYRHHTKKIHKRGSLFIHDNTCSLQILNRTGKTRNSSLLVVRFLFLKSTSFVKDKENKKKEINCYCGALFATKGLLRLAGVGEDDRGEEEKE